jgi:hypothetical protein
MNVITSNSQDKYVPWLICMDSNGDALAQCDSQTGVSKPASGTSAATLSEYLEIDSPINQTPTVHVNGQNVKTSYSAISTALCSADPSLKGCSSQMPRDADREIETFCKKPTNIVV